MTELMEKPVVKNLICLYGKNSVKNSLTRSTDKIRQQIIASFGDKTWETKGRKEFADEIIEITEKALSKNYYSLKKVINATGIILHTNLGRAPLPKVALERVVEISRGYSNLEYEITGGSRGERYSHVEKLLIELTGAEDAIVVNNNAAAVLLCLSTLARSKEVIISRGQLVEIGGSFRIPDVMAQSGAQLVEVGTTNKTHLADYEKAINENTALILKVHTSNFKLVGFSSQVDNRNLVELARNRGLFVMEDLGSGVLIDQSCWFFDEPTVQESVKSGVDIVTFSGDKLLGGPQAGIIVGKSSIIEEIKKNPLTRALRIDKMTLAALEAILLLYKNEQYDKFPIYKMLTQKVTELTDKANNLAEGLKNVFKEKGNIKILDDVSEVGGGSLPGIQIPTKVVALMVKNCPVEDLAKRFRESFIPVIGRIKNDMFLLDMRTVSDDDISPIIAVAEEIL